MDKKHLNDTLRAWGAAKKAVSVNSDLIVKSNFSTKVMHECAERMKTLGRYEQDLYDMEGQPDLPKPLETFLTARNDMGCGSCMYSSASPKHDECKRRLDHYFRSIDALALYVFAMLTE